MGILADTKPHPADDIVAVADDTPVEPIAALLSHWPIAKAPVLLLKVQFVPPVAIPAPFINIVTVQLVAAFTVVVEVMVEPKPLPAFELSGADAVPKYDELYPCKFALVADAVHVKCCTVVVGTK